jgi:hypothetical protein
MHMCGDVGVPRESVLKTIKTPILHSVHNIAWLQAQRDTRQ